MKKNNLKNKLVKVLCAVPTATATFLATNVTPVFAGTGISEIDTGMNNLKLLLIGIVSLIGVVVIVKGAMDLGSAVKDRDSSGMATGAGEIAWYYRCYLS